jgi:YbbR domain-containing protein
MAYHPFRQLGLKLISVAVALGLWFIVAGEETVERSLKIPLELRNSPELLVMVDVAPTMVDVRVRGRSGLLSQLSSTDATAMLDLSTAKSGRRQFSLTRNQVRVPFGVEVMEVYPGTVPLTFEASLTRRVPVVANVEGEPSQGFVAGKATVEPAAVEVTGPKSAVERLHELNTEPVSVAGARATVREAVAIGTPDRIAPLPNAIVTVPVAPRPVERVFLQVPVHLRSLGKGVTAQAVPPALAVTVRGPSDLVAALRPDSIAAFVDLAGLGAGRYNLSVRVEPGQGFGVIATNPSTVAVRIK